METASQNHSNNVGTFSTLRRTHIIQNHKADYYIIHSYTTIPENHLACRIIIGNHALRKAIDALKAYNCSPDCAVEMHPLAASRFRALAPANTRTGSLCRCKRSDGL
jgi:hypothetical protein